MDNELIAFTATYATTWQGQGQDVTEVLMASPRAIVKLKVVKTSARRLLFVDVQSMATTWWSDRVAKLKANSLYAKMAKDYRKNGGRFEPEPVNSPTIKDLVEKFDLEALISRETKAQNAMLTLMGQSDAQSLGDIMSKAKEVSAHNTQRVLEAETRKRMLHDEMWGIF